MSDGLSDASFGVCAFGHGIVDRAERLSVANVGGVVVCEPALEQNSST
jgi:hypothetical protein